MFRNAFFASVVALGTAGAAQAQAPDTVNLPVPAAAANAAGNTMGGGTATVVGGGDNMSILYSGAGAGVGGAVRAQPPRLARARNGYGGVSVEYLEPETAPPGREAWMVGGGENAEVVYGRPR